jgi:hypothetical protein
VNDHLPAAAVDGGDDAVAPDGFGERAREDDVDRAVAEQRRAGDHRVRTQRQHRLRALDPTNAAADAAGQPAADVGDERGVVAAPARGVEIDQLHPREACEPRDPGLRARRLDRESFALHQLHHVPVLEVDGGNQHLRCVALIAEGAEIAGKSDHAETAEGQSTAEDACGG